jgi:hypothetical protein
MVGHRLRAAIVDRADRSMILGLDLPGEATPERIGNLVQSFSVSSRGFIRSL